MRFAWPHPHAGGYPYAHSYPITYHYACADIDAHALPNPQPYPDVLGVARSHSYTPHSDPNLWCRSFNFGPVNGRNTGP